MQATIIKENNKRKKKMPLRLIFKPKRFFIIAHERFTREKEREKFKVYTLKLMSIPLNESPYIEKEK